MQDIDQIRRHNIGLLEKEFGGAQAMANRLMMSYSQYANLRDGARDSRTGKPRGMRKQTAWRFESAGDKPRGWLDQPHFGTNITSLPVRPSTISNLLTQLHSRIQSQPTAVREAAANLVSKYLLSRAVKDRNDILGAIENLLAKKTPSPRQKAKAA